MSSVDAGPPAPLQSLAISHGDSPMKKDRSPRLPRNEAPRRHSHYSSSACAGGVVALMYPFGRMATVFVIRVHNVPSLR